MPQASLELCVRWDGPSDEKAIAYLEERGYRLTTDWNWWIPWTIAYPTDKDFDAAQFLVDEWDFGWFIWYTKANERIQTATQFEREFITKLLRQRAAEQIEVFLSK